MSSRDRKKIIFIVNPISGGKKKGSIPALIRSELDSSKFDYTIWIWEEVNALDAKLQEILAEKYDGIIAIGGDGTINSLACKLIDTKLFLGIIPMGSGNGFARQLGISMNPSVAIAQLNDSQEKMIDTASVNGSHFINVAGVGFDAKVSESFANSKKRGLLNYGWYVLSEFREAGEQEYEIKVDGKVSHIKAFMLSIANGSQWGNDFFVAPNASLDDGLLDLVVMTKPKVQHIPKLISDLSKQKTSQNNHVQIIKGKQFEIRGTEENLHLDGEPAGRSSEFIVKVHPKSLSVFCP